MSTHVPTILVGLGISLAMGVVEVGTDRAYGQSDTLASLESRVTKLEQSVFSGTTVGTDVAQYVLVQDSTSAAAIEKERQHAQLVREQLAANRERHDGMH